MQEIHPKTLPKMARLGELVAIQIGWLWRFRAPLLNRWLEMIAREARRTSCSKE